MIIFRKQIVKLIFGLGFFYSTFFSAQSYAQYGNEWVHFDQNYYKFETIRPGIYSIDYSTLQGLGIVSTINPKEIQIIHNGVEIPILVEGESDGSFDPGDKILFYGKSNDGKLDSYLYDNKSEQPHDYTSLYTDSAAYFLTWKSGKLGKRISTFYNPNYAGKVPDETFTYTEIMSFRDQWFDGFENSWLVKYSKYTLGEGFVSRNILGNNKVTFNFQVQDIDLSKDAIFEALAFSESNPDALYDGLGNNHELTVYAGSAEDEIYKKRHKGYNALSIKTQINSSQLSKPFSVKYESTFGARGRHVLSFQKLSYQRSFMYSPNLVFNYTSGNSFIEFSNYTGGSDVYLWDVINGTQIKGSVLGNKVRFLLDKTGVKRTFIIYEKSEIQPLNKIKAKDFIDYTQSNNWDYIVISNKKLKDGVEKYANYRQSVSGGKYLVKVVYMDDLYNQYTYGQHHPLAIRRFCDEYLKTTPNINPEKFLLLLGKGQVYYKTTLNASTRLNYDLVPTYGFPPSDNLFTIGLLSTKKGEPAMATGRIPAKNSAEIDIYLSKVISYESLNGVEPWRKKILQLSGGQNFDENKRFNSYLKSYEDVISKDSFGGRVIRISKEDALPIDKTSIGSIKNEVEDGVSMVYYFGHGSSDFLDLSIGESKEYNNKDKYPIYYFNGCVLGNTFEYSSLCEKYILEEDAGAIVWIAGSSFGFEGRLRTIGEIFHRVNFKEFYGKSIGVVMNETHRQNYSSTDQIKINLTHQLMLHGDPAIKMFSPNLPDYTFFEGPKLENQAISSNLDSLTYSIVIGNNGKVDNKVVQVKLIRWNDAKNKSQKFEYNLAMNHYKEILTFKIPNDKDYKGQNYLNFYIDSLNLIKEFGPNGEMNNSLLTSTFIPSDDIHILAPYINEIVTETNVELVVQADNLVEDEIRVIFELDTTPFFNSPTIQRKAIKSKFIQTAVFNLLPADSIDYFWRAKLDGNGKEWRNGKFALLYGDTIGWSAGHRLNLMDGKTFFVDIDSNSGKMEFSRQASSPFFFQTWGGQSFPWRNIRINGYAAFLGNLNEPGIDILAIHPDNESRLTYTSRFQHLNDWDVVAWGYPSLKDDPYYQMGAKTGIYKFNTTLKEERDSLIRHLNRIPEGYYIFMHNGTKTGVEQWEDELFDALKMYGIVKMKGLVKNEDPFCLVGQKGMQPGEADEIYGDYSDPNNPPAKQALKFQKTIQIRNYTGSYTTEPIGPASDWYDSYFVLNGKDSKMDSVVIELFGINNDGVEVPLKSNIPTRYNLKGVDAKVYPYLKFKIILFDQENRTPLTLNRILVHFKGLAEGSIVPETALKLVKDTIWKGENLIYKVAFKNIGKVLLDSFEYVSTNIDLSTGSIGWTKTKKMNPLKVGQEVVVVDTVSTKGFSADQRLNVFFNKLNKPKEFSLLNNTYNFNYFVKNNYTTPILSVTFDGVNILDNDIVSAKPEIIISVLENDSLFYYNDLSYFKIYLKLEDKDSFAEVNLFSGLVRFEPNNNLGSYSNIYFNPKLLPDGIHTLYITAKKPGYENILTEYKINFRVITEQTITHVFPYPNPFTTSTRFVFTLTGIDEVPDYFTIQIMNIRGVVVKEIHLHETEILKIGNNISEYRWDGTDNYGDRLANGVYFYRTIVKFNNKNYTLRDEAQNAGFFENELGKIYIMR